MNFYYVVGADSQKKVNDGQQIGDWPRVQGEAYDFMVTSTFRWIMMPIYAVSAFTGIVCTWGTIELFILYASPDNADL